MIIFWNGQFVQDSEVSIPLTDAGYHSGYGVYDTMRTLEGKFPFFEDHTMRVVNDADAMDIPFTYSDEELAQVIRELVEKRWEEIGQKVDLRIRTTVTAHNYDFFKAEVEGSNILITADALKEFDESTKEGVKAEVYLSDYSGPVVKSTSRIEYAWPRRWAARQGVFETIICDESTKTLREGTFTSVFIIQDGTLLAPSEEHVLSGIARSEIIDIAYDCMTVHVRDITLEEVTHADEIFLAGSVRGVIPVIEIQGKQIGDGKPGPYTKKLQELFWERMRG